MRKKFTMPCLALTVLLFASLDANAIGSGTHGDPFIFGPTTTTETITPVIDGDDNFFDTFYFDIDKPGNLDLNNLMTAVLPVDPLGYHLHFYTFGKDAPTGFNYNFSIAANPVPLPTSLLLMLSGLIGIILITSHQQYNQHLLLKHLRITSIQ